MKKLIFSMMFMACMMMFHNESKAQAFDGKGSKTFSLTIGAANYFHFGGYYSYYYGGYYGLGHFYTPALAFNANLEFGVHKYVGISPTIGIATSFYSGWVGLHIPVGVQGNFHFYQLIADKVSKDIHSDKLDIYAGVNTGGGPDIFLGGGSTQIGGFFYVGPQVGVRYYPSSKVGITAELGYGKTIANFGVCFKMGGGK